MLARLFASVIAVGVLASVAHAGLIHRYSFKDSAVKDSVGKVDGKLKGAAKITDGKVVLENKDLTSDDAKLSYVEFNESVLPKGTSASLLIWVKGAESKPFSRILDIGDQNGAEGQAFIYLTPRHEDDMCRAAITASDTASKTYLTGPPLDDGKLHMAAIVIDGKAKKLHLFVDGKESATPEDLGDNTLDQVKAAHSWIGRSGFDADPGLSADISEFRVYDEALSADQMSAIYKAGADKLP